MLGRDTAAGRTAGLGRLKLLAPGDAAADLLDNFPKGGSHGDLHKAGVVDLAAQGEYLGALGFLRTHGGEPLSSVKDDLGDVGVGFHVI